MIHFQYVPLEELLLNIVSGLGVGLIGLLFLSERNPSNTEKKVREIDVSAMKDGELRLFVGRAGTS